MRISIFLYIFLYIFQLSTVANAAPPEVEQYVNNIINQASTMLSDGNLSEGDKISKSKTLLSQNLDFEWMASHALGRHSNSISDEETSRFSTAYKAYVIRSYSSLVRKYKGQRTIVKGVKENGGAGEYVVQTTVEGGGSNPINVNYRIRSVGNGYKISDIITEGVSLINTHQDEFSSVINDQGIDALLSTLQSK